jgi:hypothetical protein
MGHLVTRHLQHLVRVLHSEHGRACKGCEGEWEVGRGDPHRKLRGPAGSQIGHSSLNPGKLGTPGRGLTAKALRERVEKQYTGTQRTRKAVHGECTVELAKWTFLVISLCREPYEAKVSRTGLTGGMGRRTVRQRALCLPSEGNDSYSASGQWTHSPPAGIAPVRGRCICQHEDGEGRGWMVWRTQVNAR